MDNDVTMIRPNAVVKIILRLTSLYPFDSFTRTLFQKEILRESRSKVALILLG